MAWARSLPTHLCCAVIVVVVAVVVIINININIIIVIILLCCRLPPKLGETAKVYR